MIQVCSNGLRILECNALHHFSNCVSCVTFVLIVFFISELTLSFQFPFTHLSVCVFQAHPTAEASGVAPKALKI